MDIITIILIIILLIGLFIAYKLGSKSGAFKRDKFWEGEIPSYRRDAILKSRAVLGGHFTENLAPYLPDFPFLPTECRFVGKPIDFVVFKGMDEKNIDEVIFVEVKSGKSRLSPQEKNLKETVDKKKVKWMEYRVPEELTKKRDIEEKITDIIGDKLEEAKEEVKKFICEECGRSINHRGKCFPCNAKAKREREKK